MKLMILCTDYGHPERKQPSLHGRKFTPTPKFLGTAETYFVCHIGPIFQISLIYAIIGCPQSVTTTDTRWLNPKFFAAQAPCNKSTYIKKAFLLKSSVYRTAIILIVENTTFCCVLFPMYFQCIILGVALTPQRIFSKCYFFRIL